MGIAKPKFDELFAISKATALAMEKLARATGVADVSVEFQIDANDTALAFWKPWRN